MDKRATTLLAGTLAAIGAAGVLANDFKDVPQKHWAFDEVHWLRADGMLEGWGGKFHGDQDFTRYEMAKVLGRYMKNYNAEKVRVEGQLGQLRQEDKRQQGQIDTLFDKTDALSRRMGGAPPRMAPVAPVVVPTVRRSAVPPPASAVFDDRAMAAAARREAEEPLPGTAVFVPPMPVAPDLPAPPAVPTPESEKPKLSLQERIAAMRARMAARQPEAPPAPLPVAPNPVTPEPTPRPTLEPGFEQSLLEQALAELSGGGGGAESAPSGTPMASVEVSPPKSGGSDLFNQGDAARYDSIRDRYKRLIDQSGGAPARTPLPSVPTLVPTPAPQQSLPSMDERMPGDEEQPLPGMGGPPPVYDDQPLPGLGGGSAPIEGGFRSSQMNFDSELPDVGMPGIGYANGGE